MNLYSLERLTVPLACGHGGVGGGDLAGEGTQHEEGQFGRGDGVAGRGVHHHDASLGRRRNIHVVHADAGAAHDAEHGGRFQDRLVYLGLTADDDGLHISEQGQQLRFGEPLGQDGHLEFRACLEERDAARGDGVANENVHKAV